MNTETEKEIEIKKSIYLRDNNYCKESLQNCNKISVKKILEKVPDLSQKINVNRNICSTYSSRETANGQS